MSARAARASGGGSVSVPKAKECRKSGIELLRIISILAIIVHHIITYSGWPATYVGQGKLGIIFPVASGFGKFGVALFFLITGYFFCSKKEPKVNRIFPIIRLSVFYTAVSLLLYFVLNRDGLTTRGFIRTFLDLPFAYYWFITAYVLFMILSPYIKKMLDSLADKEVTKLCLILSLTIAFGADIFRMLHLSNMDTVISLPTSFIYILLGYTIRRRESEIRNRGWATVALIVGLILISLSPLVSTISQHHGLDYLPDILRRDKSIGTLLASVGCFIVFMRMNFSSKIINKLASFTLAIYLIHNNPFFLNATLWKGDNAERVLGILGENGVLGGVVALLAMTAIVYLGCCVVESIRRFAVWAVVRVCTIETRSGGGNSIVL